MDLKGAPSTPLYQHIPVPADVNALPVYLSDELLKIGGILNAILEGSAFPPHTALPKRIKEGMIVLFSLPIPPTINEAGLYIFFNNSWSKFQLV